MLHYKQTKIITIWLIRTCNLEPMALESKGEHFIKAMIKEGLVVYFPIKYLTNKIIGCYISFDIIITYVL